MEHHLVQVVALIAVLGVAAQWVAWRLRLPAIIFLSAFGLIAGPAFGWLEPAVDLGGLLDPIVKIGVAIILFEGGLSLKLHELKQAADGVKRLVSIGVVLSLVLGSLAARYIGGLSWPVSIILGAILVVTGPTVILPLLKHARLKNRTASYLKWEGIINDPTGALLAVVAFQYFLHAGDGGVSELLSNFGLGLLVAGLLGAGFGYVLGIMFRRGYFPEYLKGAAAMSAAIAAFAVSNIILEESGLLAVTVMGLVMGHMRLPGIEELRKFKEHLTIVIVSAVFLLLTADLDPAILFNLDWRAVMLIITILFIVRPVSVILATVGTDMTWSERALVAWIAPRGIVAAAMAGVFAPQLQAQGYAGAELLLPLVFAIIFVTVLSHGLTIGWLGRRLGLSAAGTNGVLFVGASPWITNLAEVLKNLEVPVLIADLSWHRLRGPRLAGLRVFFGQVLAEGTEERLEFNEADCLFAASDNDAYNSLVCGHFASELGRTRVYQLALPGMDDHESRQVSNTVRGLIAPNDQSEYEDLLALWYGGWTFQKTGLTEAFSYEDHLQSSPEGAIPFCIIQANGQVSFFSTEGVVKTGAGATLIWYGPRPDVSLPANGQG